MERRTSRSSILLTVICLFLAPVLLFIWFYFSSSVIGLATLPNGILATIDGPFSASENVGRTVVEASGRQFVFTPTAVIVDGKPVAKMDSKLQRVAIEASFFDAELSIDGKRVVLP